MLSFDSALASQLKNTNPVSFWTLKLYYNGEDNQAYQANGTTPNLINKLGSDLVTSGDNLVPNGYWTIRDIDGGTDGWSSANPPVFQATDDSSMINALAGSDIEAGKNYTLTFTVGTASLKLTIGGGDLSGNSADETYVAAATYSAATHTVTFQASANATHLWISGSRVGSGNGTLNDVSLQVSGYGSDETSIIVDYGTAFGEGDYIKIESEIMKVTVVSTHTLTVERGKKNTTKASHLNNTAIYFDDWIGLSEQDRVDSNDVYHGIVSSWGSLQHSMDFFNFDTSIASLSIKLINTEYSITGGRFSDLLATNNFANRKWELFQNTNGLSTFDTAARMIGSGTISGDIKYDTSYVSLVLVDYNSRYHKKLPINTVDSSTYANAPKKNVNKPIPMAYGDFYEKDGIGTIPTTHFDRYKQFYKGAFPAIIVDEWDVQEQGSEAKVDSVAIKTLDDDNVYIYMNGHYPSLTAANVDTSGNPEIEFKGSAASVYIPLSTSNLASESITGDNGGSGSVSDEERVGDGSFSAYASWAANSGTVGRNNSAATMTFAVPKVNKLGVFGTVSTIVKWGTNSDFEGDDSETFRYTVGSTHVDHDTIADDSETKETINTLYSGKTASWDFEGSILYTLKGGSALTNHTAQIYETGLVVDFTVENIESHKVIDIVEVPTTKRNFVHVPFVGMVWDSENPYITTYKKVPRTNTVITPSEIDYVYCSGEGRKYGAWIDTVNSAVRTNGNGDEPDPNYAANALIENPVYMIEDILRTELSLDSSTTGAEINIETFDEAGNGQTDGTKGDIALALDYAITAGDESYIKFAFSQPKFIYSKDMIERICRQICSWVWISGNGKIKIRTLLRPSDTWAADKTIDYNDIVLKSISRTPMDNVRNSVVVNYNYDYGQNQYLSQSTAASNTASQQNTVSGHNQTLELEMDADTLDSATADKIADAQLNMFKDRKIVLDFNCQRPLHNDLEITDVIKFENWDSKIKLYGVAMGTDYFMIMNISKTPFGCKIKAVQVKTLANA